MIEICYSNRTSIFNEKDTYLNNIINHLSNKLYINLINKDDKYYYIIYKVEYLNFVKKLNKIKEGYIFENNLDEIIKLCDIDRKYTIYKIVSK